MALQKLYMWLIKMILVKYFLIRVKVLWFLLILYATILKCLQKLIIHQVSHYCANFCIKMFRTVILDPGLFQMAFTCSSSAIKTTEECL